MALSFASGTPAALETLCARLGVFWLLLRVSMVEHAAWRESGDIVADIRAGNRRSDGDIEHSGSNGCRQPGGVCRAGRTGPRRKSSPDCQSFTSYVSR